MSVSLVLRMNPSLDARFCQNCLDYVHLKDIHHLARPKTGDIPTTPSFDYFLLRRLTSKQIGYALRVTTEAVLVGNRDAVLNASNLGRT